MPQPKLQDAKDANKDVRELIKKKSGNKFQETWTPDRKKKFKEVVQMLEDYAFETGGPDPDKDPIKYIEYVAKRAGEMQAGNCMQYACAAFALLKKQGVAPLEVVGLMPSQFVGHNFLILGRPADAPGTIIALEKYAGADSIFIVDGWANIGCAVKDYRKEWKDKLAKWAKAGKGTLHPFTNEKIAFEKGSGWPELFDDAKESKLTFIGRFEG